MLSSLRQGSLVHILDKTKGVKYIIGEVISRTEPISDYSNISITPQTFFDLSVKTTSDTYEFKHISSSLVFADNGDVVVSETKEALIPIIESTLYTSKKAIEEETINAHKENIICCEEILQKLNPAYAKEKERDARIDNLENKFTGVEDKLDKILTFINSKQNGKDSNSSGESR